MKRLIIIRKSSPGLRPSSSPFLPSFSIILDASFVTYLRISYRTRRCGSFPDLPHSATARPRLTLWSVDVHWLPTSDSPVPLCPLAQPCPTFWLKGRSAFAPRARASTVRCRAWKPAMPMPPRGATPHSPWGSPLLFTPTGLATHLGRVNVLPLPSLPCT